MAVVSAEHGPEVFVSNTTWGLNVGGFERAHPGWALWGEVSGYVAQRTARGGGLTGPQLRAGSLDELAVLITAAERTTP